MSLKMHISQAVRKRNGKKYRITKMIPEIKTLVGQRGSRTQIRFLKTSLDETLKSAIEYHEALMILLPDDDPRFSDEWIEELALSENKCLAAIEAYLNDRKDDPPSILSAEKEKISSVGVKIRATNLPILRSVTCVMRFPICTSSNLKQLELNIAHKQHFRTKL